MKNISVKNIHDVDIFQSVYLNKLLSVQSMALMTSYFDKDICEAMQSPDGTFSMVFIHVSDLRAPLEGKRPHGLKALIRWLLRWAKDNDVCGFCYSV